MEGEGMRALPPPPPLALCTDQFSNQPRYEIHKIFIVTDGDLFLASEASNSPGRLPPWPRTPARNRSGAVAATACKRGGGWSRNHDSDSTFVGKIRELIKKSWQCFHICGKKSAHWSRNHDSAYICGKNSQIDQEIMTMLPHLWEKFAHWSRNHDSAYICGKNPWIDKEIMTVLPTCGKNPRIYQDIMTVLPYLWEKSAKWSRHNDSASTSVGKIREVIKKQWQCFCICRKNPRIDQDIMTVLPSVRKFCELIKNSWQCFHLCENSAIWHKDSGKFWFCNVMSCQLCDALISNFFLQMHFSNTSYYSLSKEKIEFLVHVIRLHCFGTITN